MGSRGKTGPALRRAAAALLLLAACHPRRNTPELHFVDGSEGLPTEGQWRNYVAVADLDGDGRPEIIAPPARKEENPRPHIWSRSSQGRWEEWPDTFPKWSYDYGGVAVADIDRDGRPDLVFASHNRGLAVLLSRGEKKWELMTQGLPSKEEFPTRAVAAGDIDGDGWIDLATVAEAFTTKLGPTGVRVFFNQQGKGWRSEEIKEAKGTFGDRIAIADLDEKGRRAIIVGSLVNGNRNIVWERRDDGWKALAEGIPEKLIFWDVGLCDVAKRGTKDLFVASDSTRSQGVFGPRVFRLEKDSWVDLSAGLPQLTARTLAVGDLEGAGSCTLAAIETFDGSVHLFRFSSSQSQKWEEWAVLKRSEKTRGFPYGVIIADVDGDGRPDLVANYGEDPGIGGIQVWLARR